MKRSGCSFSARSPCAVLGSPTPIIPYLDAVLVHLLERDRDRVLGPWYSSGTSLNMYCAGNENSSLDSLSFVWLVMKA